MTEPALFTELKNNESKITYLLEKYPDLRDSDEKLFATLVLMTEGNGNIKYGTERAKALNGLDILKSIINHDYMSYTSMIRCRRLIQAKRIDLQGESHQSRQEMDDHFRNNIKNL